MDGLFIPHMGTPKPRHAARPLPPGESYVSIGFKQLGKTFREMKYFPETLKFLLAYFLYNDGIQTVIAVASTFAAAPHRPRWHWTAAGHAHCTHFDDPVCRICRRALLGQTCRMDRRETIHYRQPCDLGRSRDLCLRRIERRITRASSSSSWASSLHSFWAVHKPSAAVSSRR